MKILVVQDYLRSGGTERQSILLANAFAAAGNETALLTFRPGGALNATCSQAVSRRVLQPFDTRLDWFAPGLDRSVADFAPEVILCMGRMANCYAGGLQEKFPAIAVIGTMRTGKPLPTLFRRSLHTVRHIVANSAEAKANLASHLALDESRISVIYNSLVFPPASSLTRNTLLRTQHGAGPNTAVLICVAMFRPEKNQRELIELAASLPASADCQLWLAGTGPALADCEHLVASRQLGSRVKFLGFQSDPSALYRAADIAVHASRSESLSNFLIEAQAHGLPAVVYAAQGIAECFLPGQTGWVVPQGDRAAFLARLQPLLADQTFRQSCGEGARAFAASRFDPAQQTRTYLDLFNRLVQNLSRP
jgi:glycosyltransferase involved in cell wall biosynthesis